MKRGRQELPGRSWVILRPAAREAGPLSQPSPSCLRRVLSLELALRKLRVYGHSHIFVHMLCDQKKRKLEPRAPDKERKGLRELIAHITLIKIVFPKFLLCATNLMKHHTGIQSQPVRRNWLTPPFR